MLHRKQLNEIKSEALEDAKMDGNNLVWTRAYLRLADAADCLDAMIARTEVTAPQEELVEQQSRD